MPLKSLYDAVIEAFPDKYYLYLYFAHRPDSDSSLMQDLKNFRDKFNFSLAEAVAHQGTPYRLDFNLLYSASSVVEEIGRILRKHGLVNLGLRKDGVLEDIEGNPYQPSKEEECQGEAQGLIQ